MRLIVSIKIIILDVVDIELACVSVKRVLKYKIIIYSNNVSHLCKLVSMQFQ